MPTCRLIRRVVLAFACVCAPLHASGPTGEEEAWAGLHVGRHALALAPDGRRVVYVDGDGWLRRGAAQAGANEPALALPLPWRVSTLSAADGAERVALVTPTGCSAWVDFGVVAAVTRIAERGVPANPAFARWFMQLNAWPQALAYAVAHPPLTVLADPGAAPDSACFPQRQASGPDYSFAAIALSPDGRRAALADGSVLDVDSGRVLKRLPRASAFADLKFLDAGRTLFTAHVVLGEGYESPDTPSDTQFALWDLERGELLDFVDTKPSGTLGQADFLWDFSAADGHLRVLGSTRHENDVETHLRDADLAHCRTAFGSPAPLPPGTWWDFAVDPFGRWLALVADAPLDDNGKPRGSAQLLVFVPGEIVPRQHWTLDAPIRALHAAADGRTLFATTQSAAIGPDPFDEFSPRSGGGVLRRFTLDAALVAAPAQRVAWSAGAACALEDERPGARTIVRDTRPHDTAYSLDLLDFAALARERDAPAEPKWLGESPNGEMPQRWGATPDGALWLDRYGVLERINPADGKLQRRVLTPRSSTTFVQARYESSAFLRGARDELSWVPFDGAPPRTFAQRPGWVAQQFEVRAGRVLVRWADARYAGGEGEQPDGSAHGVLYDLASGAELFDYPGKISGGVVALDAEIADPEGFGDLFAQSDVAPPAPPAAQRYDWSISHFGSVRAVERATPERAAGTVLWDGLALAGEATPVDSVDLQPLGDGRFAAAITPRAVRVYDAVARRVTTLPFDKVRRAALLPHRLLLEREDKLIAVDFD